MGPTTFTALPNDAFRQIARRLPVRGRPNLALAGKGLPGPVRQSLDRLGALAAPVRGMATLPAGEPRLRAVLDAVVASAQPQLPASEQAWLLRAAVVRTTLLEPPHRFVFHRVACEESRHLPPDERATLIAVLATQIRWLPQWVTPQAPLQPDLELPFLRMAGASVLSQPGHWIFDAGIPSEKKTACALALAAHFEAAHSREPETIAVRRESFEDCRKLALELPASLQFAPLEALAAQVNALPLLDADPHPPTDEEWWMREAGAARILAAATVLPSEKQALVVQKLRAQIRMAPAREARPNSAMHEQIQRHLEARLLGSAHARAVHLFLAGGDLRR